VKLEQMIAQTARGEERAPSLPSATDSRPVPGIDHARHQGPRRPHSVPQCARSLSTTQPYNSALVQLVLPSVINIAFISIKSSTYIYKQRTVYVIVVEGTFSA